MAIVLNFGKSLLKYCVILIVVKAVFLFGPVLTAAL